MSVLERVREVEERQGPERASGASEDLRRARERLKGGLVERLGLATIAALLADEGAPRARAELRVVLEAILNTEDDLMPGVDRETLLRQVADEICGLGPIQPLLEDDGVSEVMINGTDALFYERGGEIHPADAVFDSPEQIMIVLDRILAPLGRRLDRASPIVSARLPNGDRVNAVAAPIAIDGPAVTIRKFSDRIRSLGRLVELGAMPAWYAELLSWAVRCSRSIAVAGGTGSGKTTLLNALSCEIPRGERIVTIEDSAELRFDVHPNVVRLEARDSSIEGTGEVTIRELVKNALRMRPDRIVVGEVRSGECIDMLNALSTGHAGSITTFLLRQLSDRMVQTRRGETPCPERQQRQLFICEYHATSRSAERQSKGSARTAKQPVPSKDGKSSENISTARYRRTPARQGPSTRG